MEDLSSRKKEGYDVEPNFPPSTVKGELTPPPVADASPEQPMEQSTESAGDQQKIESNENDAPHSIADGLAEDKNADAAASPDDVVHTPISNNSVPPPNTDVNISLNNDASATSCIDEPTDAPAAESEKVRFAVEEDAKWSTVGFFHSLSANVTDYIDNKAFTTSGLDLNSENLPDLSNFPRTSIEPGTAYRFRIRALNSCGASEWSDVSSFKSCMPGFPGAPNAIKISKNTAGAHLTWEPPSASPRNEIIEYSVYLAIRSSKDKSEPKLVGAHRSPTQLSFVRVYVGADNQCIIRHDQLASAHVDCTQKPAIIFRIAARNYKGYGPATQVRWLQETPSPTRKPYELGGASPSKRFKPDFGRGPNSFGDDFGMDF